MTCWARFRLHDGRSGFGIVEGSQIEEYEGDQFDSPRPSGRRHPYGEVSFESPCLPSKIVAVWNNFHAQAAKLGKEPPARALYLLKPGTSVNACGKPIRRPAGYQGKIIYEGELGIVVGRRCKDVPVERIRDYIFGYTCINDVTAVEVLNENFDFTQWCRSKGYDTFGCIGPVIATDFDWSRARVITKLDGVERQNYPLSDIIVPPERLVSEISHDMSLLPGDVIACGTSVGVGSMREGAVVDVTIEGIGSLTNTLVTQ